MIDAKLQEYEERLPWIVFLAGLVVFVLNVDLLSSGDTIYYANIIDTMMFDKLTAHQGYYVFGLIVSGALNVFGHVSTDQALTYMSALFGAGALTVGYLLAKHYLDSINYALLAALILLISHRFFENSISAEIYIAEAFFLWTAMLLFEKRIYYGAGVAIAFALWITPLTLPFCLWFAVSALLKKSGILSLVKTAVPVIVLYGLFLLFFYEELLWGNRGLLTQDQGRQILVLEGLKNFAGYQFKHYSVLNLLLLPALFVIPRQRYLFWTSLAIALPNIYVISQLRGEQNVFILPLDIIFTIWMTIGFRYLVSHRLRWLAAAFLFVHLTIFVIADEPFFRSNNAGYPSQMRKTAEIVDAEENSILFLDWDRRMAYVYFNRNEAIDPLETGYWYRSSYEISPGYLRQHNASPDDFADYSKIFVLESWEMSTYAKMFLSDSAIEERTARYSKRMQLERFLSVSCSPVDEDMFVLYECGQVNRE